MINAGIMIQSGDELDVVDAFMEIEDDDNDDDDDDDIDGPMIIEAMIQMVDRRTLSAAISTYIPNVDVCRNFLATIPSTQSNIADIIHNDTVIMIDWFECEMSFGIEIVVVVVVGVGVASVGSVVVIVPLAITENNANPIRMYPNTFGMNHTISRGCT